MEPTRAAGPVKEDEASADERAAAAPVGGPGRVLALQRAIGNRAVMQLLRSSDPNFWTLFQTADGRWKAAYIFVRPKTF